MISKFKNALKTLQRGERGITGMETAIILIAFVVVASVFAYTVLSAGIFSSQSSQEAIYTGLEEARSPISLSGFVVGKSNANATALDTLVFSVKNSLDGEAVDLTGSAGNQNVVTVTYHSATEIKEGLTFTATQVGWGDNDALMEPGETFEMTVSLTSVREKIDKYDTFAVEVKPPQGSVLKIERTLPANLDRTMILN